MGEDNAAEFERCALCVARVEGALFGHVPASAALGLFAVVCVALIAYEAIHHREERAAIRARRAALSAADIARVESERR